MYGRDADPISLSDGGLETVVDALDLLAGVLPEGHELFTAVLDPHGQASDVLVRDTNGATSVVLGLAQADHQRLTELLGVLRQSLAHPTAGGVALGGAEVTDPPADSPQVIPEADADMEFGFPLYGDRSDPDFRAIVEESPIPLIVIGADGIIEYASPAVMPTLGIPDPTQMEGLFLAQFLHTADRERVTRITGLALNRSDSRTLSVRLRRPDGTYARAEMAVRGLPGHESLILVIQEPGTSRDGIEEVLVTERRQRALAATADSGTALLDATSGSLGAVIDLNPAFGRLVDGTPGQLVGTPVWELVRASDVQRVRQAVQQVSEGGGPRHLEVQLMGTPARRANMVVGLDRSSGDPPTLVSVLLRDVTQQQGTLGDLNRAVERLERENEQLAEFARVTAHDLMAPLRALEGLVEILEPAVAEPSQDALVAVQSAVQRMVAMVDSAVGFAGAQVRELVRSSVDLKRVARYAMETLAADIAAANASITVGDLPFVTGDAAQLERLFASLISNALNYHGDSPPDIEIHALPDGSMWRISVTDQGIGVEPTERESIFRLFARRTDQPVRAGAGRGIGLATCRQIVELHGGRIWVEPNVPQGAIFAFTLPGN